MADFIISTMMITGFLLHIKNKITCYKNNSSVILFQMHWNELEGKYSTVLCVSQFLNNVEWYLGVIGDLRND